MENYENIYKSICRLCLSYKNSKNMVSLIDESSQDGLSPYAKAVSTFAHISFKKPDYFPSNMCFKCLYLLKQVIYFKLVTESSDKCLKQLENSVGDDKEVLKEKIVEYTMLKFYFPAECFKTKRERCQINKNLINISEKSELKVINENGENVSENQLNNNDSVNDDAFETPLLESETEHEVTDSGVQILDKIENLIGTDICEPSITLHKMYKRKRLHLKRRNLAAYKLARQQRRLHQKDSLQVKNLVCSVCSKVLANQLTYDHHMQRHNGCRYICEHCGKGFPVLTELQVHQVTRHGTGPYLQCSHCPFKAPRKFDLIEHERIHSGERPYTCDKCGLTFRRRGIWRKHLIYHTEKKVQCPQCPRKFFQRSEMLAHANNIHDRVYVYLCSKCGATYAKTATVRRHMTERHGIPREMQGKIIRINKGVSYQEQ